MFAKEVTSNENQGPKDSSAQTSSSSSPTGEVTPSTNTSQLSLPSVPLSATAPANTDQAAPQAASPEQTAPSIADKTFDAHTVNSECNQKIQAAFDSLRAGAAALAKRLQDESPESKDPVATALGVLANSVKTLIENGQKSEEKLSAEIKEGLESIRKLFETQVAAQKASASEGPQSPDVIVSAIEKLVVGKLNGLQEDLLSRCTELTDKFRAVETTLQDTSRVSTERVIKAAEALEKLANQIEASAKDSTKSSRELLSALDGFRELLCARTTSVKQPEASPGATPVRGPGEAINVQKSPSGAPLDNGFVQSSPGGTNINFYQCGSHNGCLDSAAGRGGDLAFAQNISSRAASAQTPVVNVQVPKSSAAAVFFGSISGVLVGAAISIGGVLLGVELGKRQDGQGRMPVPELPQRPDGTEVKQRAGGERNGRPSKQPEVKMDQAGQPRPNPAPVPSAEVPNFAQPKNPAPQPAAPTPVPPARPEMPKAVVQPPATQPIPAPSNPPTPPAPEKQPSATKPQSGDPTPDETTPVIVPKKCESSIERLSRVGRPLVLNRETLGQRMGIFYFRFR